MSTLSRINFEPVQSTVGEAHVRHVVLADKTLVQPYNPICLYDGEWMTYNAASKAVRATDITTPGAVPSALLSWPNFAERGRSDLLAMAEPGVPLIMFGQFEFDTRIFDATAVVSGGAAVTFVTQPLKVATITFGGRNFSGLVGATANDNSPIVAYCTRLPANNGSRLRILQGWAVKNGTT